MQAWDKVYKEKGKYFLEPHESIPGVAELFKKKGIKRVLDLGCGTGRHVVYLAGKGFDVYGFDPSRTGISIASKWLRKEKLSAHLVIHDMNKKFPYKDGFFDAVIATSTLHHNTPSGVKRVIGEVERVLREGGILFFTVPRWRHIPSGPGKWKQKKIAPHTYLPLDGMEKGLPHFYFDKKSINSFFHDFRIAKMKFIKTHYNVIAVKKTSR